MTRHPNDHFPTQTRYRGVEPVDHDPFEAMLAAREAAEAEARAAVARGHTPLADPTDLRGIPCLAKGSSSTIRGTDPLAETIERERIRNLRKTTSDRM